jgi:Cu(I)/Ag(I) efflux system membrane protein CusA/SilA
MIGGMISSTLLTLLVIPAIFGLVKGQGLPDGEQPALADDLAAEMTEGARAPQAAE